MGCSASKDVTRAVILDSKPDVVNGDTVTSGSNGSNNKINDPAVTNLTEQTRAILNVTSGGSTSGDSQGSRNSRITRAELLGNEQSVLHELRANVAAGGDLIHAVVRIETPFGKPIEEVYSGVRDGRILGSGASGIVRLVSHRATGVNYAVKCLDIMLINSKEQLRQLRDEIFIMCQLDHPNIVRIEEVYESTSEIFIVQELCVGGDLFDRLDEQPGFRYNEVHCAKLVKQMLGSLHYIHARGIIHRDLKLENFLFASEKHDSPIKMIDFGLSKHFEIGEQLNERVGTPYTVAPEILVGRYDEKCDVWALGVITYLLISGQTPFGGLDGESLVIVRKQIMAARVEFEPEIVWRSVSEDAKKFIKQLLTLNPLERPSAKDCQTLDWIKVWAQKSATDVGQLNEKTLTSLLHFKEKSDIQKLLSEVLSFTLLPEQIEELRKDFEQIDQEGAGEISLESLKKVLIENAEARALGALSEKEIEDVFDAIRVRKDVMTIRWHEFLAAGLSQARIDDRNLRIAFDRLDYDHKGFITYNDLESVLGSAIDSVQLETMWTEGIKKAASTPSRITFHDFKLLMKGQPNDSGSFRNSMTGSIVGSLVAIVEDDEINAGSSIHSMRTKYLTRRSQSYDGKDASVKSEELSLSFKTIDTTNPTSTTTLAINRTVYRKNREMRLAVLEASKTFDLKRNEKGMQAAGLIMKRGVLTPAEIEDKHNRALFGEAAKRCGRPKTRNKTVSDVSELLDKRVPLTIPI